MLLNVFHCFDSHGVTAGNSLSCTLKWDTAAWCVLLFGLLWNHGGLHCLSFSLMDWTLLLNVLNLLDSHGGQQSVLHFKGWGTVAGRMSSAVWSVAVMVAVMVGHTVSLLDGLDIAAE